MSALVVGVFANPSHTFSKLAKADINLVKGLGVEGDAHFGRTVQHVWDKRKEPDRPNLRQVHLLDAEIIEAVNGNGFPVMPGDLGENITTSGIDLRGLSAGTILHIGVDVVLEVTGLRSPCIQIERFQRGLKNHFWEKPVDGPIIRKAGIMSVVLNGGLVRPGDRIIPLFTGVHVPLGPSSIRGHVLGRRDEAERWVFQNLLGADGQMTRQAPYAVSLSKSWV